MQLKVPVENLERCPECRSRRLVVANYGPYAPTPFLECEGCWTVVKELIKKEVARMRSTPFGRRILARKLS